MNCGKTSQIAKPKRFEEFGRKNTDLEGSFAVCSFSPWHFEILSELGVGRILEPRADFLRSGVFLFD